MHTLSDTPTKNTHSHTHGHHVDQKQTTFVNYRCCYELLLHMMQGMLFPLLTHTGGTFSPHVISLTQEGKQGCN